MNTDRAPEPEYSETIAACVAALPEQISAAVETGTPTLRTVTLFDRDLDAAAGFVLVVAPIHARDALAAAVAGVFGPPISNNVTVVLTPTDDTGK